MVRRTFSRGTTLIWLVGLILVVSAGIAALVWMKSDARWALFETTNAPVAEEAAHSDGPDEHDDADHHDHAHAEHGDETSIEISDKALKNIGYEPTVVKLDDYERSISMPGIVVERPGKSQVVVSAPLTGRVTKTYVIEGEAVEHDSPLFEIRLTHEDLVVAQSEFLEAAQSLDVVSAEIKRLQEITEGVIAGRRILEQQYEQQKLKAKLEAQRQALLLHGLTSEQVAEILKTRQLLATLTIDAPSFEECPNCEDDHPFHVQSVDVQIGQQVQAGTTLAVLADHCELYIEGTAFEADTQQLREALKTDAAISADVFMGTERRQAVKDLKLLYLADRVDRQSRALHFYVSLPNEIVADRKEGSHRFVQWRFNPGQRVELNLPVERWSKRLVVPSEAIVKEGPETYVYRQSGDHFTRVTVHVEHRDQDAAVIANDGTVFPGEVIAARGAFQIHLALKNQSGGPIDPHAGHSH